MELPAAAAAAGAGALHPARRAEDPAALGAVPRPHSGRSGGLAALARQLAVLLPLRPRARVEPSVAAGEVEAVQDDARGDARAAVGDELPVRQLGQRPRSRER